MAEKKLLGNIGDLVDDPKISIEEKAESWIHAVMQYAGTNNHSLPTGVASRTDVRYIDPKNFLDVTVRLNGTKHVGVYVPEGVGKGYEKQVKEVVLAAVDSLATHYQWINNTADAANLRRISPDDIHVKYSTN